MNTIKLIASDLDGTLLTTQKELTSRARKAILSLHDLGIYFVPSTGRPFAALPECIKELPYLKYVITSNGASVYDAQQQRDLFRHLLTPQAVDATLRLTEGLPVLMEFFIDGQAYIDQNAFDHLSSFHLRESHAKYIRATRIPVKNFLDELEKNKSHLENINLIFHDMELRQKIWDALRAQGLASVTASSEKNIEITSLLATKANALSYLCAALGILPENVLAMGDRDNDLPMLEFAGTGVAMENGEEHIKAAADIITASCDDYGAALILEKIIKKGKLK